MGRPGAEPLEARFGSGWRGWGAPLEALRHPGILWLQVPCSHVPQQAFSWKIMSPSWVSAVVLILPMLLGGSLVPVECSLTQAGQARFCHGAPVQVTPSLHACPVWLVLAFR